MIDRAGEMDKDSGTAAGELTELALQYAAIARERIAEGE
jgi:hypothetical protein